MMILRRFLIAVIFHLALTAANLDVFAQNLSVSTEREIEASDFLASSPDFNGLKTNEKHDADEFNDSSDECASEIRSLKESLAALKAETEALQLDLQAEKKVKKTDPNGPFSLKLGGQLIMDADWISQNKANSEFYGNAQNTYNLRDARLTARGSGYGNIEYACVIAFSEEVKFQDFYLRYKDSSYLGDITVGHFFVESGMESETPVFEKSFATLDENALFFRQNRRVGIGSTQFGSDKRTRCFFGAFLAKSFNTKPYYLSDDNPGLILNARATGLPIYREDEDGVLREVLHLGASCYWLDPAGGDASMKFRSRGLGWTGSTPYIINGTVSLTNRSYSVSEAEIAWQREGFATIGEGFCGSVEDGGSAYGASIGGRYFLTPGCSRVYVKDSARFGGARIPDDATFRKADLRTLTQHWGAWEVLAKWSWTEANHLRDVSGATFGSVDRLTVGVNWFWNEKTYWTLDWERAFVDAQKGFAQTDSVVDSLILQTCVKF